MREHRATPMGLSHSINEFTARCCCHLAKPQRRAFSLIMQGRNPAMFWIEPYYRIVDGKLQHVRGHWRHYPNRKPSGLYCVS